MTKKCYSQGDQDIIIHKVFEKIEPTNKFCVEFGHNTNSLTSGSGANTANLILNKGWRGLLFDGDYENENINLYKEFLSSENICDVFKKHNVPTDLDYLSIDVDSTDLWLFDKILTEYSPKLVSVEYNSHYSIDEAITFPNDVSEVHQKDRGFGASLKALVLAAKKHNYHLVYVERLLDAFFIHDDYKDLFEIPKLSDFENDCSLVHHVPLKIPERHKLFLDYEVYLNTNGDVEASREAALEVTKHRLIEFK
jgi:hypothetical protein